MSKRFLDVVLRASNRRLKSDLRNSQREIKAFAGRTRDVLRSGFAAGIGGFAGFASVDGLAQLGRDVMANGEALTRIGIQASLSAEQMRKVQSVAQSTAQAFGMKTSQVIGAATAIVNLEGAAGFSAEKMQVLAKAAVATGANMQDLAGISYAMKNAFGITEVEELEGALSAVTEAGKMGSIPLNEMSTVLQQIAVNFSKVGASGKAGAADLAAAMQVARTSFGSASETGTGLKSFIAQLEQNADKFRSFGVRVTEIGDGGKEKLRPLRDILDDIGKSPILKKKRFMTSMFGSQEARQFLEALVKGREQFEQLSEAARKSNAVQADSQRFLASSSGQLKLAIAEARGELETMFTPERIHTFVSVIKNQLVPALDFVLDNARTIGIVIVGWKLAGIAKSAGSFALALGKGVGKAGGLAAVFGKIFGSAGGVLRLVLGFAGPIGLAAAAVWGLAEAFAGARKESAKLTEEQVRQAELAGEVVGKISAKDVQGRASRRRAQAKQLRDQAEQSNKILFSEEFAESVREAAAVRPIGPNTVKAGRISGSERDRILALQDKFRRQRGVLDSDEHEQLGGLLRKAGILDKFAGGEEGLAKLKQAKRLELEADAIELVGAKSFGQRGFKAEGFDVAGAVAERGLNPEQAEVFQRFALRELGGAGATGRSKLELGLGGARVTGLAVGDGGTVQRREAGRGLADRVQAVAQTVQALATGNVEISQGLADKLAELNSNLVALAERPISVQVDGTEVARAVANSAEHRRSPR